MDPALRALNRFGLGARSGERERVAKDPRAWLRAQLAKTPAAPEGPGASDVAQLFRAFRAAARSAEERRNARTAMRQFAVAEQQAALVRRVTSDQPFAERLVAFWSNHLCVSTAGKLFVAPLAGAYERDVVRRHLFGKFSDMVLASAQHPAMLLYLDNTQSIGPNSPTGRRSARARRGLNENYARELLELHTLGVDGGYTQQDVIELARILTGWTITGALGRDTNDNIGFRFQPQLHEPGSKTLLGVKYDEAGVHEGERAIRALCKHPSTARFIARKLATHFIADTPPPTAVERLAKTFRDTDGDLRALARTLIDLPEAWSADTRKLRSPQDWLVAVWRAFEVESVQPAAFSSLRQLRHPLWAPPSPKGFSDAVNDWADPDSLLNRAELARTLARQLVRTRQDPRVLLNVVDVARQDPLRSMISDNTIAARERIALAIASPAFQWR